MVVRSGYVDTHVGQLHFRAAGASGPVVVMLHQTASSSKMFEGLMVRLEASFRLVAFDTPGFGNSVSLPGSPSIDDFSAVLSEAAANLGLERFHLVGHHTGAAIATQLAADQPESVRSLTMIGALGMGTAERTRWLSLISRAPIDANGSHFTAAWGRVANIDSAPIAFPISPELQHREAVDLLLATPRWPEAYLAVFTHNYEAALERVECPVLMICGDEDILWPYFAKTVALKPHATTFTTHAGAYILDQQPEEVTPVIENFLELQHATT